MKTFYLIVLSCCIGIFTVASASAQLQAKITTDPDSVEFIMDDVFNFLKVLSSMEDNSDTASLIQSGYIDKASPALNNLLVEKNKNAEDYLKALRKRPADYNNLVNLPRDLEYQVATIRNSFMELKTVIPHVVFMPVYFMVSPWSGCMGEPSEFGLKIAIGELDEDLNNIDALIVHEMVHVQQVIAIGIEEYHKIYGPDMTLLSLAIREGTAYYLTYLATGKHTNKKAYDYLQKNEQRLWQEFKENMYNGDPGEWMWQKPSDAERPMDLGYVLGAMIIKSYYDLAESKEQAILDILSVTDYRDFFEKSGYAKKF